MSRTYHKKKLDGVTRNLEEELENKTVDASNCIIRSSSSTTQLQMLRRMLGYSQKMLAEKSGVSLRMIQQYEQRAKDINRASGTKLFALARTLGCNMEDLMEFDVNEVE